MKKILITSVGSRVGEGIVDSLAPRRAGLTLIGTNSEAAAPNNFRVDRTYLVPPSEPPAAFVARLRPILLDERPDLVLAGRDGDLEGLAILQTDPALSGIRFLSPPPAVAAITRDKYRTFELARAHGLPFAESAIDEAGLDELIRRKGLPLIGKPRAGNASIGVTVVRSREEGLAVLAAGGTMLQEFLAPPADLDAGLPDLRRGMPLYFAVTWQTYYTPLALVGEGGGVIAYYATRHTLFAGKPTKIVPVFEPALEQVVRAYAKVLGGMGLTGPLNVQCHRLADGSFATFELNARFSGGSSARAQLGHNEVLYALDYYLDGKLPAPPPPSEPGFVVKSLVDWVARDADVARLRSAGAWEAGSGSAAR